MMHALATPQGRFQLVAWLEGLSYLVLLGIAMPLKYLAHMPLAVRIVGSLHGLFFVLYVFAVVAAFNAGRWRGARAFWALVASMVPFGPFVFEAKLRREDGQAGGAAPRS
ncbi:MAG: DUF3817 domain-containing protein [Polyangiaceae bacterium]|jgi:integral membrane protein|nr:DUF3817 domain-containing protein [Polyangiaceae bacterium]